MSRKKRIFIVMFFFVFLFVYAKGKTENLAGEYFSIAEAYAELKKYDKAIEFYGKAAKDSQYTNSANYNIARMHGINNRWSEASSILETLYMKAPDNEKISSAYAYALASSDNFEKAVIVYENIYSANKDSPQHSFNYVRILIAAKKYKEAESLLEDLKNIFVEDSEKKIIDELKKTIDIFINPKKVPNKKENEEEKKDDKK